jgi:tetratricopeptide (TPR) repeat protein
MSKESLLREGAEAFEQLIAVAHEAAQHGVTRREDTWGPREIVAHLAGWEVIATVHIPSVVALMPPLFAYPDPTQHEVLNDALNTMMITLVGDQSLENLCALLRQTSQQDIEMLQKLDDAVFQPGHYVYERTKAAIEHCQEHIEELVLRMALLLQEQGKYTEAEPLFKQALTICEGALGSDHPHTQSVRRDYDRLLQEMRRNS